MRIGSLFSGVGGLELGLEWSGIGHTVWQVEISDYCRAKLAARWPGVERFSDVRSVGKATLAPVDLVCGGFPCTGHSPAGKKTGFADPGSSLWFEYLRIVAELLPGWVVVENSGKGADRWVDTVRTGLAELGYACLPVPLAAADVGAPQLRERVFMLACNSNAHSKPVGSKHAKVAKLRCASERFPGWTERPSISVANGTTEELAVIGNAVVPQCSEVIGHIIQELMAP